MDNEHQPGQAHSPQLPPPIPHNISPAAPGGEAVFLGVLCHISLLLGIGLVVPLIVYLVKRDESAVVSHHAKEALNFHLSVLIYSLACAITCVGIILIIPLSIGSLILAILATIKAAEGKPYRYPMTLRLVS